MLTFPRARLRWEISLLPQKAMVIQLLKVSRSRARLSKKVKDFLLISNMFLPPLEEFDLRLFENEVIDTPPEESVEPAELLDGALDEDIGYDDEDESESHQSFQNLWSFLSLQISFQRSPAHP